MNFLVLTDQIVIDTDHLVPSECTSLGLVWLDPLTERPLPPHPLHAIACAIACTRSCTPEPSIRLPTEWRNIDSTHFETKDQQLYAHQLCFELHAMARFSTTPGVVWAAVQPHITALLGYNPGESGLPPIKLAMSAEGLQIQRADPTAPLADVPEQKITLLAELFADALPTSGYTVQMKLTTVKRRLGSMLLSIPDHLFHLKMRGRRGLEVFKRMIISLEVGITWDGVTNWDNPREHWLADVADSTRWQDLADLLRTFEICCVWERLGLPTHNEAAQLAWREKSRSIHTMQDLASLCLDFESAMSGRSISVSFSKAKVQWHLDAQRIIALPKIPSLKDLSLLTLARSKPPLEAVQARLPQDLLEQYHTTVILFATELYSPEPPVIPLRLLPMTTDQVQRQMLLQRHNPPLYPLVH